MYTYDPTSRSMSLGDLKRLIKTGEGTYLEFKRTISSPEKIAREVCAFANTKGGTLLLGVDDDKSLVGVNSFYEEEYEFDKVLSLCDPEPEALVETVPLNNREIVMIKIRESKSKPVFVQKGKRKTAYVRDKDKSIRANRERLYLLKNDHSNNGITFEYGANEQKLFRYLNEYDKITVKEYANLIDTSNNQASKILVNLVSLGVLNMLHLKNKDYFTLTNKAF